MGIPEKLTRDMGVIAMDQKSFWKGELWADNSAGGE